MSTPTTRFVIRLLSIVVISFILVTAAVMACKIWYTSPDSEHFFFNSYDRTQVADALDQPDHRLTLQEYVNIMNSTQNLNTMSLQQLTGNMILGCDDPSVQLDTVENVRKWVKAVAGQAILDTYAAQDWYRLAMILLKTFDSIAAIDRGYTQWFERTPTNGVFGVESVRMMKDGDFFPFKSLPAVPELPPAPTTMDQMFTAYRDQVYPLARNAVMKVLSCRLYENRAPEKCGYLSIPLFCHLGCVMLYDVYASS